MSWSSSSCPSRSVSPVAPTIATPCPVPGRVHPSTASNARPERERTATALGRAFDAVLGCTRPGTGQGVAMVGATGETDREGHDELDQLITRFQPRASKLRPARAQLELVQRTALVGALLRSQASLVVVSAPAGYGKSTLLAQWADAAPVPASWLQLDATDNDPVVFLSYLTAALSRVAPVDATVADLLQVRSPPIDELILPRLGDALEAAQPFLLVLDDAHLVQSEACWHHLALLFEQLPPGACLALGTRSEPPLPLARLRAEGRLADVRLGDLRLTRAEAGELLRLRGAEADDEALNGLLELTEGWATGLYLALLAGKGRPASKAR